jgi:group II intron reverse transcriptase/maturase
MSRFSENLSPELIGIHRRAQREKHWRFTNLLSLITPEVLWRSFHRLRRDAASGIDRVSWDQYGEDLLANIARLHERIRCGSYRAPSVRRVYIPKANGKCRPLGIPTVEDKIVQRAVADILMAIYEADFLPVSFGYRPDVGAAAAHTSLNFELQYGTYGHVVEADIQGFFDHLDHEWLMRMLAERIADRQLLRLIRKWLRAGILEPNGHLLTPVSGSPQGGIVSPVLANVYLHYALDLWFVKVFKKRCNGQSFILRYADDFVVGFQYQQDAEAFVAALPERLSKFCLSLEPSKTAHHRFSRFLAKTGGSFDFLGFTYRWIRGRNGKMRVSQITSRQRFKASLNTMKQWLIRSRSWPRRLFFAALKRKLAGYASYYGIPGNSHKLKNMDYQVFKLCHKWLNRCSQRRSYTRAGLYQAYADHGIPPMRVQAGLRLSQPFLRDCV